MKILAFETATRCNSVAVVNNSEVLTERVREDCVSHTRMLLPAVDEILKSIHLALCELDGVAVSIGPGSFTGLRVGLSTGMAIRVATGLPLVGVSTLEALAWNVRDLEGPICPMIRSRVGEVYWALFAWSGGGLTRLSQDQVGTLEQCANSLTEPVWVLGDGWEANQPAFSAKVGPRGQPVPDGQGKASAVSVARASLPLFRAKRFLPIGASPAYVQPSQAELQWNQRNPSSLKSTAPRS